MNGRKREVARRLFAYEFNRSTHKIGGEDERSPVYVLTPTGMRCNRVFVVGVLLDKEETRPDTNFWRIRVSDPTGVFIGYVGRFQPDALETILEVEPPELVAIVAKVRLFEGETRNFASLRPESIAVVDSDVRDYWVCETARLTLERIKQMEERSSEDAELAWQIYNPDLEEYRTIVRQAVQSVVAEYGVVEEAKEKAAREEEKEEIEEIEDIDEFEEEFDFEEEEWDLSDILGE
ncbi:hypothetical protein [Archaeoglobus veneficus]|uniref:Nucleic acid binding OB-fold tRNA/helicase-type n=1 Tax=Archaeoglobus veneficus (strain DSM 11195 / SNP6) TaxID=693661 RepID=F2KP13_ARCVS|nr:hypothetical protein [Archaeoglobus veneficus]AEA46321.1 hypothetical protein Arcve_0286 [Archaeoglobus veneficus SNP6]